MSKRHNRAKPCRIRVTRTRSEATVLWAHSRGKTLRYPSVRAARRDMLAAASCMTSLSRCSYAIDIVTDAGEVIPVRESVVDHVESWNRWDEYTNSIGARLARGETVVV